MSLYFTIEEMPAASARGVTTYGPFRADVTEVKDVLATIERADKCVICVYDGRDGGLRHIVPATQFLAYVPSLEVLFHFVTTWQRETFKTATPQSIATHLREEAEELEKDPESDEELADVLMLAFGLAYWRKANLVAVVSAKLQKNVARQWGEPDENGVVHHIKDLSG